MDGLEILHELKKLHNLIKNSQSKILKEEQNIKDFENRIKEIRRACEHDYEYESAFYYDKYTCKYCGHIEIC